MKGRWWGATAVVLCLVRLSACTPSQQPYEIAVFGDVPYSSSAAAEYEEMIDDINASTSKFSVHVGDIGPGSSSTCTTATVDTETARFDTFTRPLVYTPGDNEWTDCGSSRDAQLAYIRATVFRGDGAKSRGQTTMKVQSQASLGYPENARWRQGPVTFATLHMVGGGDNYKRHTEHDARRAATIAWMRETFAQAKDLGHKGVVLLAQVDPSFADPASTEYHTMYDALLEEVQAFDGQVLFAHGDGHDYISDSPVDGVDNLRRVEVEGDGKVSYIKVRIDPSLPELFVIPEPTGF